MGKTANKKTKRVAETSIDPDYLRQKLKIKHLKEKAELIRKHPHADMFFKERKLDPARLREHSAKIIGTGVVAGSLLFNSPQLVHNLPPADEIIQEAKFVLGEKSQKYEDLSQKQELLSKSINSFLPSDTRPLDRNEEKLVEELVRQVYDIKVKGTLEGEHLNTTYGVVGAEQHLRRYPGDELSDHGSGDAIAEGIAPGLGAWGYFAPSRADLTEELVETEKWYVVVQTLYLPDWNTRHRYLREWYKHRKVIMINAINGKAVIGAIADSGPAAWTGKHYGGSPEVMDYLGGKRYKKGPVLVFFVDDPDNQIPLGPIN